MILSFPLYSCVMIRFQAYDPIKDYGMTDLSPESWDTLAKKVLTDSKLASHVWDNRWNGAPQTGCGTKCQQHLFCRMTSASSELYEACKNKYQL